MRRIHLALSKSRREAQNAHAAPAWRGINASAKTRTDADLIPRGGSNPPTNQSALIDRSQQVLR
jgi:hypothetical protein